MRLSEATAPALPDWVARLGYDRARTRCGIVHLGTGAFHRAHQAIYADEAMAQHGGDWGIVGASLRSTAVQSALDPQDGLFCLTMSDASGSGTRLVGALKRVLAGRGLDHQLAAALAAPNTHIVTMTVTEKGYCREAGGSLDFSRATAGSIYAHLAAGLTLRRAAGLGGLTIISCDNMAENGRVLRRSLREYLAATDAALGDWIDVSCRFPSSMVDRIVPATTNSDRAAFEARTGIEDCGLVLAERFSQWVIEDDFAGPRPGWEAGGAQIVADVAPYEAAKLRMLNGAHSALAYLGLEAGYRFVHEAIGDPRLRTLVERLMRYEAAPTIDRAPGQDLAAYADAIMARFANAALGHRLDQIAADGSQKLPQRWFPVLAIHQRKGSQCPAILTALAAWLRHISGGTHAVDDPMAGELKRRCVERRTANADPLFGSSGLFALDWTATPSDRAFLDSARMMR